MPTSATHRYFFKVYALDYLLTMPPATNKEQLLEAMKEYIIAYSRNK